MKSILRIAAGIAILLIGIIGLFLPILQGIPLIILAVLIVSPDHGKRLIAWIKTKVKSWISKSR